MGECKDLKAASNNTHKGHGAADRRCPIFLARLERMKKTRSENKYKFFCTSDPATWETNKPADQDRSELVTDNTKRVYQEKDKGRGRLGGGKRGKGGGMQRVQDKGWEGMRVDKRTDSNKDNGRVPTEAHNHGNMIGTGYGSRDKDLEISRPSGGGNTNREYKKTSGHHRRC